MLGSWIHDDKAIIEIQIEIKKILEIKIGFSNYLRW